MSSTCATRTTCRYVVTHTGGTLDVVAPCQDLPSAVWDAVDAAGIPEGTYSLSGHLPPRSTRVDSKRSASKANSARRHAFRESCGDRCMTCGLVGSWSSETPEDHPAALHLGHVVGTSVGGGWTAGNVGPQHRDCNLAARDRGIGDLTTYTLHGYVPARILPTREASYSDRRHEAAPSRLPGVEAIRNARQALSLPF